MAEYLFVYGTLRQGANHPMHQQLIAHARFVAKARYQALLYQVSYYPAAEPSDKASAQVIGELYQLLQPELLLPLLDQYEECGEGFPQPQEYRRELQQVTLDSGASVNAWVYIYNRSTAGLRLIASGDFLPAARHMT
ncbi:MAG: gamma-glutamylcyclotransferase [Gammaproteobacteria bacterium]|nr:gamma-glutamylcyclotransferase [Gammaproteobacteria bacterium]MBU1554821.1 gamma-glutamylcyclotransferase [Gammaproteobacteria bacterium]MBU2068669.1 gamma-glutamylcyclotransferase [Gammaproteobacteria bacterium]MBU2183727.1 gamma-glutamylcyclotransferase [Gammaproteobacteria bacterium]MBU2205787.1 gamma-glutamylcyclotransferase [Gammaproteobacteria bacterium]